MSETISGTTVVFNSFKINSLALKLITNTFCTLFQAHNVISTGLLVSEPLKLLRPYKYDAILHSLHYIMTDAGYSFAFSW